MRVMLENPNDEVAAMEERVTHTREARSSLQLRHNETLNRLSTTQQELVEAISTTTRAQEAEALKDRQIATLREEQLQKDREIETIRRQLNSSEATAREAHSRFQVQMEVRRQLMLPPSTTPAYTSTSSSMHNQLAFPPLTPASGVSTQELRVPTTYQAGPHTDQRGTPSGSSAMNAMYAGSGEDINDNKYILITMCIFGQWSNMIQMKNFKWIVGRTRESMSLYWDAQAIGNLTVRALSKKFLDHAIGDRLRRLKIHLNMLLTNLLEATFA